MKARSWEERRGGTWVHRTQCGPPCPPHQPPGRTALLGSVLAASGRESQPDSEQPWTGRLMSLSFSLFTCVMGRTLTPSSELLWSFSTMMQVECFRTSLGSGKCPQILRSSHDRRCPLTEVRLLRI